MNVVQPSDNGRGPIIKEKFLNPREITEKSIKALLDNTQGATNLLTCDKETAITIIINPTYIQLDSLSDKADDKDHPVGRVRWTPLAKGGKDAILANGRHRIELMKRYRVNRLLKTLSDLKKAQNDCKDNERKAAYEAEINEVEHELDTKGQWLIKFYHYSK